MEIDAPHAGGPVKAFGRALTFTVSTPGCDRVHHVTEDDVRVILSRLPMEWCERLWSEPFDHPDPVHNPPGVAELAGEAADLVR